MSCLMKGRVLGFVVLFVCICYAQHASSAFASDKMSMMEAVFINKKTFEQRSVVFYFAEKVVRNGEIVYKFTEQGKGDYCKYMNVTWETSAEVKIREDGLIFPLLSNRTIWDENRKVIIMYSKLFDYNNEQKTVTYTKIDAHGTVLKKKIFPMKGITIENVTLPLFLGYFLSNRDNKEYSQFYLITDEPYFKKISIQIIGEEKIALPEGKFDAIKLRIFPDLGVLNFIARLLAPPLYFWYTADSPYSWLQYEGLECGLGSTHVIVRVVKGEGSFNNARNPTRK